MLESNKELLNISNNINVVQKTSKNYDENKDEEDQVASSKISELTLCINELKSELLNKFDKFEKRINDMENNTKIQINNLNNCSKVTISSKNQETSNSLLGSKELQLPPSQMSLHEKLKHSIFHFEENEGANNDHSKPTVLSVKKVLKPTKVKTDEENGTLSIKNQNLNMQTGKVTNIFK